MPPGNPIAACLLAALLPAATAAGMTRMAVIVGNNAGLPDEKVLQFAARDAENVSATLEQLGGVDRGMGSLLLDRPPADLMRALDEARARIAALRARGQQVQLLIYYSGHGSEEALHMNGGRLPMAAIRESFRGLEADLKILIADACFSGALLREKGGSLGGAVPVTYRDELKVNGSAILTSSSAGELSQESRELRGSLFTHYFVSAIRGAGDADRDGSVSLWEAYAHTLSAMRRKLAASGKDQNPEFEVDLRGSENVVLTRVRLGQAFLSLKGVPEGRYQVLEEPAARPVAEAEVLDPEGITLALPKGRYLVYRGGGGGASGQADLGRQARVTLSAGDFRPVAPGSLYAKGMRPAAPAPLTPFRLALQPRFYPAFPGRDGRMPALDASLEGRRGSWGAIVAWVRPAAYSRPDGGGPAFRQDAWAVAAEARRYWRGSRRLDVFLGPRLEWWSVEQAFGGAREIEGRMLAGTARTGVEARFLRFWNLGLHLEAGWQWSYDGGGALRRDFTAPLSFSLGFGP